MYMIERIIKNKNQWHLHSLSFCLIAIIAVLKYELIETSMIFFGLSVILNGIGDLFNQNKNNEAMIKKLIIKSREDVIYERMKEYEEKGESCLATKEQMQELFDSVNKGNEALVDKIKFDKLKND